MGLSDADLPEVFITGCSQVYYKEAVAAMIVFITGCSQVYYKEAVAAMIVFITAAPRSTTRKQ